MSGHKRRQQTTAGGSADCTQNTRTRRWKPRSGSGKVPALISISRLSALSSKSLRGTQRPAQGKGRLHSSTSSWASFLAAVLRGVMPEKDGSLMRNTRSSTSSTAGQAGSVAWVGGGWARRGAGRAGGTVLWAGSCVDSVHGQAGREDDESKVRAAAPARSGAGQACAEWAACYTHRPCRVWMRPR